MKNKQTNKIDTHTYTCPVHVKEFSPSKSTLRKRASLYVASEKQGL